MHRDRHQRWSRLVALAVALLLISACSRAPAPAPATPASPAPATPAQPAPAVKTAAPPSAEPGAPVPKFKLLYPAQAYMPELYEACGTVARELTKLGFNVEPVTHPSWGAFTAQVGKPYDWGLGCGAYVPRDDRLEPNQLLGTYHSSYADGGPNYSGYQSPEFDAALVAQRSEMDLQKRQAAVRKAQEIMARDVPFIALMHPYLSHIYNKSKFGDVKTVPGIGLWNFNNVLQARPLDGTSPYRVGFMGDMYNLNPAAPISSFGLDLSRLINEPLARIEPDGRITPWLAEKWSADSPTTLRVTVRQGHRFHDGRPVTARDVAFSYNYLLKWKPSWYRTTLEPLKNAEALDDRTVLINLKSPFSPIFLTLTWLPILPEHIWKDVVEREGVKNPAELKNIPRVGSGPFKWGMQTQQVLQLTRNDDHFSPAKANGLTLTTFGNRESHFLSLVKQDIFFHEQKGMTLSQVEEAKKYPYLGIITEPSIQVQWLILNMRENSPFRDYRLRQAVAHVADRAGYIRDILKGEGDPGRGMIAPANKLWANVAIPDQEVPGKVHYHQYDPAKARSILQSAGLSWDAEGKLYFPKNWQPQTLPTPDKCCP